MLPKSGATSLSACTYTSQSSARLKVISGSTSGGGGGASGVKVNFTEASTDPARFYRPDVFHRLRAVKAAYDPDNLFRANHPIPLASS